MCELLTAKKLKLVWLNPAALHGKLFFLKSADSARQPKLLLIYISESHRAVDQSPDVNSDPIHNKNEEARVYFTVNSNDYESCCDQLHVL